MTVHSVNRTRIDVLGVHVSAVDFPEALNVIGASIDARRPGYVCVSDVNAVLCASADAGLREVFNSSTLTVPDGVPLVWAGRVAGARSMSRVCGPDLMPALLDLAAERGWSSYFVGGTDEVNASLLQRLRERKPNLKIAGSFIPPFRPLTPEEDTDMVDRINASGADIVWVGLGAPKQERWMGVYRPRLEAPMLIGVGGAFDMHAGVIGRAPRWMQRTGLEWSYRLAKEPRRLWRRYLRNIPWFIISVVRRPVRVVRP
ncbi:WecB/TagA/CpsF family glycosyltransferase [Arthrobacter tecti]